LDTRPLFLCGGKGKKGRGKTLKKKGGEVCWIRQPWGFQEKKEKVNAIPWKKRGGAIRTIYFFTGAQKKRRGDHETS